MSLLTVKELRAELKRLAQVHSRLMTMKPQMINQEGLWLWEQAVNEIEDFEREVRLALAITEEGSGKLFIGRVAIHLQRGIKLMNDKLKQTALQDPLEQDIFDLGTHTLEVLNDQGVLLTDNVTGKETVQLDEETTYLLLVVLTSLYQQRRK